MTDPKSKAFKWGGAGRQAGELRATDNRQRGVDVTEEETLALIRVSISSVWALELLLLLWRTSERCWAVDDLVRELRASATVVTGAVAELRASGFVDEPSRGTFQYHATDAARSEFVQSIEQIYASKPVSVIKEIMNRPDSGLKSFSDAFRFRD